MPGRKTRTFGSLRRLPSGRWQARYRGPDGLLISAPVMFVRKADGARWLALTEAELLKQDWIDPRDGLVPLEEYGEAWIAERPGLRPKTIQLYRYLLRRHIVPGFTTIGSITEADVRRWRAELLDDGVSPVTAAKAYRLLKSILATAVEDSLIRRNPCRVKGAGTEQSPERPLLTVAEVYALADACGPRYRVMVLLACFGGLPWGEVVALRRRDIDIAAAAVRISRQLTEARGQAPFFAPPKTAAGRRRVILPGSIVAELQDHLDNYTGLSPDALLFTSPRGELLRHSNFWRVTWVPAMTATGLTGIHFHDLRHAGNHLVAEAGATLRELMERMGHASSRAALIYLHSTDDRQRALAEAVEQRAIRDRAEEPCGTSVARDGQTDDGEQAPIRGRDPPDLEK
jgi:integrase